MIKSFLLESIIAKHPVFQGLHYSDRKKILNISEEVPVKNSQQILYKNEKIVKDTIYIVCRGELSLLGVGENETLTSLKLLKTGDIWFGGELTSDEHKKIQLVLSPRSILMKVRLSDLYYQLDYRHLFYRISKNLGIEQEHHDVVFEESKNTLLMMNKNELEFRVAATQSFVTVVLCMVCLYICFLKVSEIVVASASSTVPITLAFLSFCLISYVWFLRQAHLPGSVVGLTFVNTRAAVKEALVGAPPLLFIAVVVKWVMIHTMPSLANQPMFDLEQTLVDIGGLQSFIYYTAMYTFLSVPLQELIVRGVQGCLQMIFTGRKSMWPPIFIANTVFASIHIIISPFASLVIFFPGLYWGWLFARHQNLIGVCVSHAIFGTTAIFFLGFLGVLSGTVLK